MPFEPGARIPSVEILDAGTASDRDVRESLSDLRWVNRWLGGRRIIGRLVAEQSRRSALRQFTVLDAGTGSGDLPDYLAQRFRARVVGLDRHIRHLRQGVGQSWTPVCGDLRAMPFPPRSFDFVTASLILHHFAERDAVDLLAGLAELARYAVLVNDLQRHALAWRFIRHCPWLSEVSRLDGAASVQQAFTRAELEALARRAGLARFRVRHHAPFRLSLVAELA